MSDISTTASYFPDPNYARILVLSGFFKSLQIYVKDIYSQVVVELGGLPHGWEKFKFIYEHIIPYTVTLPISIILLSYLSTKFGIRTVVKSSIYAYSLFIVLLSVTRSITSLNLVLVGLGLTNGLDAVIYAIISHIYGIQYQSFAFALLFFDSYLQSLFGFLLTSVFDPIKKNIPNWFIGKLLVLQYPFLITTLGLAVVFSTIAYNIDLIFPKEVSEFDTALPTHTEEETQTLVSDMDQVNYNSITSTTNTFYNNYISRYNQNQELLLISSFILNQFLIKFATTSLQAWYSSPVKMGGLGLGFENVFPTLYLSLQAAYYLGYLYLPTTLNHYSHSLVYHFTYNIVSLEFAYLIALNFLYHILPTFLLNLFVGLGGISLLACSLYANLASILMVSKLKSNYNTILLFGLSIGGSRLIEEINNYFGRAPLFIHFANLDIKLFTYLNPSLVIFLAVALLNRHLAYNLHARAGSV